MKSYQTNLFLGILALLGILIFRRITVVLTVDKIENADPIKSSPENNVADDYDYYSSLVGVQNLAKQEQQIVKKLVRYRKKLVDTLELIDLYMDDYSKSIYPIVKKYPELRKKFGKRKYPFFKAENHLELISEQISGNPLMVFKLLRRFATTLTSIWMDMESIDHHTEFKDYIDNLGSTTRFPSLKDLSGAADGLLRVQETYQLHTTAMSNGMLINKKTNCKLQAYDMLFIGVQALIQQRFATGMEWLYSAYQKSLEGDNTVSNDVIEGHLLMGRHLHNDEFLKFKYFSNLFSNLINSSYKNIPELYIPPAVWEHPVGLTTESLYDVYNFHALCRGEQLLSPEKAKSLHCWYSHANSPFNIISPLKIEMYNEDPPLLQIYDLISDRMINHIKNVAMPHLKRGKVIGTGSELQSDVRTSSVAWLVDVNINDSLLSNVPRIVNRATGLECSNKKAAEDLQVSCYGSVGGYYISHFDALLQPGVQHSPERLEDLKRGDRVATIMFYLSDVELGGGTAFPRLGVAAKAVKGSAVFWYNLKLNGGNDLLSLHGGCPVLYGNKWVANKWIRLYEQLHVRKCSKVELE